MFALVYQNDAVVLGRNAKELLAGWAYEVRPDYLIITKTPAQCKDWQSRRLPLSSGASTEKQLLLALYLEGSAQILRKVQGVHDVHEIA